MTKSKIIAVLVSIALLAGCTEPDGSPGRGILNGGALDKQDVGTGAGVVGGALIGSAFGGGVGQAVAIVAGGLLGGVLGNEIGRSLDDNDRAAYDRASQRAMQTGQSRSWRNTDSGNYGTISPGRRYRGEDGQYCRRYTQTIVVDGEKHQAHGKACREDDGTWHIVE